MYTFLARFFHLLHRKPKTIVLLSLFTTLAALYYARQLPVNMTISELYPENLQSVSTLKQIEKKFGGLGQFTVVIHSTDSTANREAVEYFAEKLRNHPDVNFLEYRTQADFYRRHKLLYINLEDLRDIQKRVETGFWLTRKKQNPILIDLLSDEEKESSLDENITFEDLERKYFSRLQEYLGNRDRTTMVLRLFPEFDITNIRKGRAFHADMKLVREEWREANPSGPEVLFTGEVIKRLQNEGRLFSQIIDSGKRSVLFIAVLLFLFFLRVPSGMLLSVIPAIMAIVWTLALTWFAIGYLNLITASLGFVLIGIGLDGAIHLLTRYAEERRKGLSAEVAFETITLETGPAITTSFLVTAAAFFMVTITPFQGLVQFGLMAGLGMLCTLVATMVVFPCLLIAIEPIGLIPVFGSRLYNRATPRGYPYRFRKRHGIILVAFTLLACMWGIQTRFEFSLEKLGFPNTNRDADSLLQAAGEAIALPAVVIAPSPQESQRVADFLRRYSAQDTVTPTIEDITTMMDLLPADQQEKLSIIETLKRKITPEIITKADEPLRTNLEKLQAAWDVRELGIPDLPLNYQHKFIGRDSLTGTFTFVFPSVDLQNGVDMLAFADDVQRIALPDGEVYHASSEAIVQADLLRNIIPDVQAASFYALALVFVLVLLDLKTIKGTLLVLAPLVLGLLWTLGIMKWLNIPLHHYNLVVFPAMVGISIENSVHLYHRYLEEGQGSVGFVMRRTAPPVFMASLTGAASFFGFAFSPHQGLSSLGLTACIAIGCTFLASVLLIPFAIGYFESRRFAQGPTEDENLQPVAARP